MDGEIVVFVFDAIVFDIAGFVLFSPPLFNRHLTGDRWNVDLAALPHLLRPDHGHDRPHQRHRHRHAGLLCKTSWLQLP